MQTYMHPDLYKLLADQYRLQAEQDAAKWRLLRRADVPQRWLARQGCWLLSRIGQALIWSGRRLQKVGAFQAS